MSIDEKLYNVINSYAGGTVMNVATHKNLANKAIAQIKQAFADEGYMPRLTMTARGDGVKESARVMTGQEWYDRFETELEKINETDFLPEMQKLKDQGYDKGEVGTIFTTRKMLLAVRKAAGIGAQHG